MATILNTTQVYAASDYVTSTNLNQIISGSTFVAGPGGTTDDTTLEVDAISGSIQVKPGGIGADELGDNIITADMLQEDSVTTVKILDANVTFAKLTDVIDDDTMDSATDTTLATSESIKAYIDKLKPNIVQAVKTDVFQQLDPNNAWFDIPDLSVSITPKFSNSKMLVQTMVCSSTDSTSHGVVFKLVRDTTDIGLGDTAGDRTRCSFTGGYSGQRSSPSNGMDYIDEPTLFVGTPISYKVQCTCEANNDIFINRANTDSNANEYMRPISTLTITEIYQ